MRIAGIEPFTTIDFPGKLACVLFAQGCPNRCPFCHNPDLQKTEGNSLDWAEVIAFLNQRKKMLDGVVFSGGEPLMQPQVVKAIQEVKQMGYQVAVHTSGVYFDRLKEILPNLSWVGLDVKAPSSKYDLLTGRKGLWSSLEKSLKILLESGIDFEARTTCDPRYLTVEDINEIMDFLSAQKVPVYALQKYRTFDEDKNPPSDDQIEKFFTDDALMQKGKKLFSEFICR